MTVWNFYFQIFEKAVGKQETILFLTHLLRYIKTPLLVVWDRLPAHRSRLVGQFLDSLGGWIAIAIPSALCAGTQSGGVPVGSLEAPYVAQRMSQGSVATQRGRAPNLAPTPAPTAPYYRFLETVFFADRLSYIMRISVSRWPDHHFTGRDCPNLVFARDAGFELLKSTRH